MGQHFQYKLKSETEWRPRTSMPCFGWLAELTYYHPPIPNHADNHIESLRFSMSESNPSYRDPRNAVMPELAKALGMMPWFKGRVRVPEVEEGVLQGVFSGNQPVEVDMQGIPADILICSLFVMRNCLYLHHLRTYRYLRHKGLDELHSMVLASIFYPQRGSFGYNDQLASPSGDSCAFPISSTSAHTVRAVLYGNGFTGNQAPWGTDESDEHGYLRDGEDDDNSINHCFVSALPSQPRDSTIRSSTYHWNSNEWTINFAGFNKFVKDVTGVDYGISFEDFSSYAAANSLQ